MAFDDISAFADHSTDDEGISKEKAFCVAAFVREHAEADTLPLHCAAGVSRSRSMAAAICDVRGLPYQWTVVNDDVYRRLRVALLQSMSAGIADEAYTVRLAAAVVRATVSVIVSNSSGPLFVGQSEGRDLTG